MRESGISLYPVSAEWEPPFTMLTTLRGAGDQQARAFCVVQIFPACMPLGSVFRVQWTGESHEVLGGVVIREDSAVFSGSPALLWPCMFKT